jgi:hypothetical protein
MCFPISTLILSGKYKKTLPAKPLTRSAPPPAERVLLSDSTYRAIRQPKPHPTDRRMLRRLRSGRRRMLARQIEGLRLWVTCRQAFGAVAHTTGTPRGKFTRRCEAAL